MPAIDPRKKLGANGDLDEGYHLVTGRMQRTLTRLLGQSSLPVVG